MINYIIVSDLNCLPGARKTRPVHLLTPPVPNRLITLAPRARRTTSAVAVLTVAVSDLSLRTAVRTLPLACPRLGKTTDYYHYYCYYYYY